MKEINEIINDTLSEVIDIVLSVRDRQPYLKYLAKKNNGEKMNIYSLTREEFISIFYDANQTKKAIAGLFDCSEKDVQKVQNHFRISLPSVQEARVRENETACFVERFLAQLKVDHFDKEVLTLEDISEVLIKTVQESVEVLEENFV